jgi:hypothetical protein
MAAESRTIDIYTDTRPSRKKEPSQSQLIRGRRSNTVTL